MEQIIDPEKLQNRINEHEMIDLLYILDKEGMKDEYPLLLQRRLAKALEEVNSNLSVMSATLMSISNSMAAGATDQREEIADNE